MDDSVEWSNEAVDDLQAIADYISQDSEIHARTVLSRIRDLTRGLPDAPYLGRILPELNYPNIRERFVYEYRVIYRLNSKPPGTTILAIIHGRRLLQNLPGKRLSGRAEID